jgi:hypothetical protein
MHRTNPTPVADTAAPTRQPRHPSLCHLLQVTHVDHVDAIMGCMPEGALNLITKRDFCEVGHSTLPFCAPKVHTCSVYAYRLGQVVHVKLWQCCLWSCLEAGML